MKQSYAFGGATPIVRKGISGAESILSPTVLSRLNAFLNLIREWSSAQNLLSAHDLANLWERHVLDSLQLIEMAPDALRWLDFGSGAGFPAIVIACCLADMPGAKIVCVESNRRKSAFLSAAARKLSIPVMIHACRIEDLRSKSIMPIDVVTARALKAWPALLTMALPYLSGGAVGLFPLGGSVLVEQSDVPPGLECEIIRSATNLESLILRVKLAQKPTLV